MTTIDYKEMITLRIEQVAAQYGIARQTLTLTQSEDFLTDMVIVRLVRQVATVPGVEDIRVPATWRDGLLEQEVRRSPIARWWVRRRPIQYRTYRALEVLPDYPELDRYRASDGIRIARLIER